MQSARTTTLQIAITLSLLVPFALAQYTGQVLVCYTDATGPCHTNLVVNNADFWKLGAVIVCADHINTHVAGSTQCPQNNTGEFWACAPPAGGYCNVSLVEWTTGDYAFDVNSTGGVSTVTMGNFQTPVLHFAFSGGTPIINWTGTSFQSVTVPDGILTRVLYNDSGVAGNPGTGGGGHGSGGGTGGGTSGGGAGGGPVIPPQAPNGVDNVIVHVGLGTAGNTRVAKIVAAFLGVVLMVAGDPKTAGMVGFKRAAKAKPRVWVSVIGFLLFALAIIGFIAGG